LATATSARIAFIRGTRELVTVDPDGQNQQTVVRMRPGYSISAFTWAPNGRRIAFSATTPRYNENLYVVNVDGKGLRKLAQWKDFASRPDWSPRGSRIVYDKHYDGDHQLRVIKADGSGARRLTPHGWFNNPSWSPDGTRIVFYGRVGRKQVHGIYVVKASGGPPRLVTRANLQNSAPEWSPANRIAFYIDQDLWMVNRDGSGKRIVIKDTPETWNPFGIAFSPNGRTIAFAAYVRVGNSELMVGEVSGAPPRRLTNNTIDDSGPTWSPDGSSLAFSRGRLGAGDIWVINADGSAERNLTSSASNETLPAWAPQ
jgi:TolB protein